MGTPYCITVDGQTLTDGTVTIRDRDTLEQWRVKKEECLGEVEEAGVGGEKHQGANDEAQCTFGGKVD